MLVGVQISSNCLSISKSAIFVFFNVFLAFKGFICFRIYLQWHLCTDFVFRFSSRQTHALLCLNNLFGSLDTAAFGGVEKLYPVWQGLVTLSKEQNCKLHDFIFNMVSCNLNFLWAEFVNR